MGRCIKGAKRNEPGTVPAIPNPDLKIPIIRFLLPPSPGVYVARRPKTDRGTAIEFDKIQK